MALGPNRRQFQMQMAPDTFGGVEGSPGIAPPPMHLPEAKHGFSVAGIISGGPGGPKKKPLMDAPHKTVARMGPIKGAASMKPAKLDLSGGTSEASHPDQEGRPSGTRGRGRVGEGSPRNFKTPDIPEARNEIRAGKALLAAVTYGIGSVISAASAATSAAAGGATASAAPIGAGAASPAASAASAAAPTATAATPAASTIGSNVAKVASLGKQAALKAPDFISSSNVAPMQGPGLQPGIASQISGMGRGAAKFGVKSGLTGGTAPPMKMSGTSLARGAPTEGAPSARGGIESGAPTDTFRMKPLPRVSHRVDVGTVASAFTGGAGKAAQAGAKAATAGGARFGASGGIGRALTASESAAAGFSRAPMGGGLQTFKKVAPTGFQPTPQNVQGAFGREVGNQLAGRVGISQETLGAGSFVARA